MGRVGEAIGFLKEAKDVSPEDEVVRVSLARLESQENLFDGAGGRA